MVLADQQSDGSLVSQRAQQVADTQRLMTWKEMEDLEKEAAAAHQRVQELEASLADIMVGQDPTHAIPNHCPNPLQ